MNSNLRMFKKMDEIIVQEQRKRLKEFSKNTWDWEAIVMSRGDLTDDQKVTMLRFSL